MWVTLKRENKIPEGVIEMQIKDGPIRRKKKLWINHFANSFFPINTFSLFLANISKEKLLKFQIKFSNSILGTQNDQKPHHRNFNFQFAVDLLCKIKFENMWRLYRMRQWGIHWSGYAWWHSQFYQRKVFLQQDKTVHWVRFSTRRDSLNWWGEFRNFRT